MPPSNRSRRESRDVHSATHSTLADRLELLAIARAAPFTSSTTCEALDSGYSSEDNECASAAGPRTRRRRSSFADTAWVTKWLSRIARAPQDVQLDGKGRESHGTGREHRRVEKLASEALALVDALQLDEVAGATLVSGSRHIFPGVSTDPWRASTALARRIIQNPDDFGACNRRNRTLELGAGSGLVSLVCDAVGDPSSLVVASDNQQKTLEDLSRTFEHDACDSNSAAISSQKLDWAALHTSRAFTKAFKSPPPALPAPLDLDFDTIIASDVVYRPSHAAQLRSCVEQLLARPSHLALRGGGVAWQGSAFWLAIPVCPSHTAAIESIEETFSRQDGSEPSLGIQSFADEVRGEARVRIYRIGWC